MRRALEKLAAFGMLSMILFGTWPILFGKKPVDPLVTQSDLEWLRDYFVNGLEQDGDDSKPVSISDNWSKP